MHLRRGFGGFGLKPFGFGFQVEGSRLGLRGQGRARFRWVRDECVQCGISDSGYRVQNTRF